MISTPESIRNRRRNRIRTKPTYRPPNSGKPGRLESGGGR